MQIRESDKIRSSREILKRKLNLWMQHQVELKRVEFESKGSIGNNCSKDVEIERLIGAAKNVEPIPTVNNATEEMKDKLIKLRRIQV